MVPFARSDVALHFLCVVTSLPCKQKVSCEQCNPLLLVFYTLESRSLIVRLEPEGIDKHLNQVAAVGRYVAAAARGPFKMRFATDSVLFARVQK